MTPEVRRQTARLFNILEYGEHIAKTCASRQAMMVDDRRVQRFLKTQSKQEAFHALFFSKAGDWLLPKQHYKPPKALCAFHARLEAALSRGDWVESLIGQQVVLEGFGEQVISRLNKEMDEQGVGFKRMRYLLLRQEQSHQLFGHKMLLKALEDNRVSVEKVNVLVAEYLDLVDLIIHDMDDVFVSLDACPDEYIAGLKADLPDWLFTVQAA